MDALKFIILALIIVPLALVAVIYLYVAGIMIGELKEWFKNKFKDD